MYQWTTFPCLSQQKGFERGRFCRFLWPWMYQRTTFLAHGMRVLRELRVHPWINGRLFDSQQPAQASWPISLANIARDLFRLDWRRRGRLINQTPEKRHSFGLPELPGQEAGFSRDSRRFSASDTRFGVWFPPGKAR